MQRPTANSPRLGAIGLTLPERLVGSRILLYARGGGIGHFNRAYAIARQLSFRGLDPLIVCSTAFLPLILSEPLQIVRWPGRLEQGGTEPNWPQIARALPAMLAQLEPDLLVVDTFPEGPEWELHAFLSSFAGPRLLIQRDADLSWVAPCFKPYPGAGGYILNRAPCELLPRAQARSWLGAKGERPLVLVAHNGNPAETQAFFWRLLQVLQPLDCTVRLASLGPCPRPEWQALWVRHFPLSEWLRGVDLLIGGGGYNLVSEVRAYGIRALLTAFERPVDQQALRIADLPHFSTQTSVQALRTQIQTLLEAPPPAPEIECQGAEKVADQVLNLL